MLSKNEKMFLTRNSDAERWMLLMTRRPSATTPGSAAKSESSRHKLRDLAGRLRARCHRDAAIGIF